MNLIEQMKEEVARAKSKNEDAVMFDIKLLQSLITTIESQKEEIERLQAIETALIDFEKHVLPDNTVSQVYNCLESTTSYERVVSKEENTTTEKVATK